MYPLGLAAGAGIKRAGEASGGRSRPSPVIPRLLPLKFFLRSGTIPLVPWLFQAAPLPPVYVTVQQPAGGMPDWLKIALGGFLAILASLVMEYVKPIIERRAKTKLVLRQLIAELTGNMDQIDGLLRVLKDADQGSEEDRSSAIRFCRMTVNSCQRDRFDYYFAEEKALAYEIDDGTTLKAFYIGLHSMQEFTHDPALSLEIPGLLGIAHGNGKSFLERHNVKFVPGRIKAEAIYKLFGRRNKPEG